MNIVYRTMMERCPDCNKHLRAYKTETRHIISVEYGSFTAIHRLRKCKKCQRIFRSESLDRLIEPYCTYANDIMIDAAVKRFIDGRSCSEISLNMNNGISERHVRNLSNMALDIFPMIHEEVSPKLRKAMESYILQIDGTTDSEFSMIIAVRDAISDFTLHTRKCYSESHESVKGILQSVKEKFGPPSGITSDMRAGILSAAMDVFPGVPVRICLMHFLRDLGTDLMEDMHIDIGKMINRAGIKSPLQSILRSIPDYDQKTLYEIEDGFCSRREEMETMAIRGILESLLGTAGSSGYGFPFTLKHLNFFTACNEAERKLSDLSGKITGENAAASISIIMEHIALVTGNSAIKETANKLSDINSLIFQRIRQAFKIPDRGSLSDDKHKATDDPIIHENCIIVIGEMEVYLHTGIPSHLFTAAKHAIEKYRERESMLFAQNPEHTIPRTNNGMEQFFRKVRRNVRKRCGNIATGNILAQSGENIALFQNMGNQKYRDIVFGSDNITALFAKYRKPFRKKAMTRKRTMELVDAGMKMILEGTLQDSPYSENMMEEAYSSRNVIQNESYG